MCLSLSLLEIGALHALEDRRDALADADAHGRQAQRAVALQHRVNERRGDSRAAGPQCPGYGANVPHLPAILESPASAHCQAECG